MNAETHELINALENIKVALEIGTIGTTVLPIIRKDLAAYATVLQHGLQTSTAAATMEEAEAFLKRIRTLRP